MWAYESVFYQIYPIGFCDAPRVKRRRDRSAHRKVSDWAGICISRLQCRVLLPDF